MESYRIKIVAANWKMNTTLSEGIKLLEGVIKGLPAEMPCKVIIAPPYTHLAHFREIVQGTPVHLAAQNFYHEVSGAFTGEISAAMLTDMGIEYVIIGHSERRSLFHDTNELVKLKLNAALKAGLRPILCCGESLEVRQTEKHNVFVRLQLENSLFHLEHEEMKKVVIAYEPIWAIGTGVTATSEQAQEMQSYIRDQLAIEFDKLISEATPILYGGSIKPDNAKELFSQEDVDGGLVGGASLDGPGFLNIIKAIC
jgi:triosephosphate isomerase